MDENAATIRRVARFSVQNVCTVCLEFGERAVDVLHLQTHMVETFAFAVEKACHA